MDGQNQTEYLLEGPTRFSESLIWQLQRQYFEKAGIDAWRQKQVPHYITSNPMIARTYAALIFAFLRDLVRTGPPEETVYFLELGAGSGRLAFHLLHALERLRNSTGLEVPKYCFVISDFAEQNLEFWQTHSRFQPFIAQGIVDFSLFDALSDSHLSLRNSQVTLGPNSLETPLIVIANYFFDSIPQDLFYFDQGNIYPTEVALYLEGSPDLLSPEQVLQEMYAEYTHSSSSSAYPEPHLTQLLSTYADSLENSYLLFPHVGIKCLDRLKAISKKGICLISADKGNHRLDELQGSRPPDLVTHGSFSLSVNYHSLRLYCEAQKGVCLSPRMPHHDLALHCFLMTPHPEIYREFQAEYDQKVNDFSPDDFFSVKKFIERQIPYMSLQDITACIKLSGFDARLYGQFHPRILELVGECTESERWTLFQLIPRIWDLFYPLAEEEDLAFSLGILLCELNFFREAIRFFQLSMNIYGAGPEALGNMAICHHALGELDSALSLAQQTLDLNPQHSVALELVNALRSSS